MFVFLAVSVGNAVAAPMKVAKTTMMAFKPTLNGVKPQTTPVKRLVTDETVSKAYGIRVYTI